MTIVVKSLFKSIPNEVIVSPISKSKYFRKPTSHKSECSLIGLSNVSRFQTISDDDIPRYLIVPSLSVYNDELYMYGRKEWIKEPSYNNSNSLANLADNNHHNKLSEPAKRKAKRAIKFLLYNSAEKEVPNQRLGGKFKFKVNFITLTLSSRQMHSDQEIKQAMLNQFFVEAKKKWNLSNYVWKSERQRNGNVHFHILSDVWIPYKELRDVWNRLQNKLGYIDRYYEQTSKHDPNSTDIHSLRKIDNVASYVMKYMTKRNKSNSGTVSSLIYPKKVKLQPHVQSVSTGAKVFLAKVSNNGRVWTCSHSLSNIKGGQSELDGNLMNEIDRLCSEIGVRRVNKEHFSGVYFDVKYLFSGNYPCLYSLLNSHVDSVLNPTKDSADRPQATPKPK